MLRAVRGPSRFKVVVEGQAREVEIVDLDGQADAALVTVDGERFEVRAAPDDSVLVRPEGQVAQRRVTLDGQTTPASVAIAGRGLSVAVKSAREAALEAALAERAGAGGGASRLAAPMPGRVIKVLVAEGESVRQGAPVIIIEAMKMENEMYAPIDGHVRNLKVSSGDTVDSGALLCEIEPLREDEDEA